MWSSLSSKLQTLRYSFYQVPWCVPPWGWHEFRSCMRAIFTGHIIEGPDPQTFAELIKSYLNVSYAIPVNRGRTALELALRALDAGTGADVVTPSYVCQSVLEAIKDVGARPVFADVGDDLNVTAGTIKAALTPRTKCVIVPHLFGRAAPIDEIEKLLVGSGIGLIDDAAQSFGARCGGRLIGTYGNCGVVGCGPGKSLAGPAGAIFVTNERSLYEWALATPIMQEKWSEVLQRVFSFWLWRRYRRWTLPVYIVWDRLMKSQTQHHTQACYLSNIEAGIAVHQVHRLRENAIQRQRNADNILSALGPLKQFNVTDLSIDGMALKLILVLPAQGPTVEEMAKCLERLGVETQPGYTPLHFGERGGAKKLPVTESLWNRVICIPIDISFKKAASLQKISEVWMGQAGNRTAEFVSTVNP